MTDTDVVVVVPGIMGSTLGRRGADGSPARDNLVWASTGGAVWRLLTGKHSIIKRELPSDLGDRSPDDGIEPVGLMPDVHALPGIWTPIKGYSGLVDRLRDLGYREGGGRPPNLVLAAYDWRLSNRYNGQRLGAIVEPVLERWRAQGGRYADARLVFVCHSMGGLVARWYIEKCGGAELTRKLITLGTPWRGASSALEQLVNGVRRGIGPLSVDLTGFARSLPSLHQLLPEFACIASGGDWAKTTETSVPELSADRIADAMRFHVDLQDAETARPESKAATHMIVGARQPTSTTVTLTGGRAVVSESFGAENDYGDGTVPLTGAVGLGEKLSTNLVVRVPEQHGNLQGNDVVLDQIQGILEARDVRRRVLGALSVRARIPDLVEVGAPLEVGLVLEDEQGEPRSARVVVEVRTEGGELIRSAPAQVGATGEQERRIVLEDLPPGTHTVTVRGEGRGSPVEPVTSATIVWPAEVGGRSDG